MIDTIAYRARAIRVMYAHVPAKTHDEHLQVGRFLATAVEQIGRIPGVGSAGAAMGVPTGDYGSNGAYVVDGRDWKQRGTNSPQATFSLSGPGYFATMGIPLVGGRDFIDS